jgi:hypothetical protein
MYYKWACERAILVPRKSHVNNINLQIQSVLSAARDDEASGRLQRYR